jgi:hypothetical protein
MYFNLIRNLIHHLETMLEVDNLLFQNLYNNLTMMTFFPIFIVLFELVSMEYFLFYDFEHLFKVEFISFQKFWKFLLIYFGLEGSIDEIGPLFLESFKFKFHFFYFFTISFCFIIFLYIFIISIFIPNFGPEFVSA